MVIRTILRARDVTWSHSSRLWHLTIEPSCSSSIHNLPRIVTTGDPACDLVHLLNVRDDGCLINRFEVIVTVVWKVLAHGIWSTVNLSTFLHPFLEATVHNAHIGGSEVAEHH